MTTKTKSQIAATDVAYLLRSRAPLLWIVTREEARVEQHLIEAAKAAGYPAVRTWDVGQGVAEIDGKLAGIGSPDIGDTLTQIRNRAQGEGETDRCCWILRDAPVWLKDLTGAAPCRMLRNLARAFPGTPRDRAQAIIVLTPSAEVPQELSGHATVIEWPMPDRAEIADILDTIIASLKPEQREEALPVDQRAAAIDAAVGLTGEEAQACYAKSLVQLRRIDIAAVAQEKKRVITRERVLEWYDPLPGGLESVGGLENLKTWLNVRTSAYSPEARAYGLPAPKGIMVVGVPGCGKSLLAKAAATNWGVPLLKLDLGALKSKFVGESEQNLRKAFKVIEAIGRCVVWVDEIEKALQGATSDASDGGVSSDALGALLNWMQERTSEAFVIATANKAEGLPPELLRKGRFDELWFVDLPNFAERIAIIRAALKANGRPNAKIATEAVAQACDQYTGAEIAALVPDAMFAAFNDGAREVSTQDLLAAAKTVVPLSTTAKEKITALREWSRTRARPASAALANVTPAAVREDRRELDLA